MVHWPTLLVKQDHCLPKIDDFCGSAENGGPALPYKMTTRANAITANKVAIDRKSTRLNSSHYSAYRMPSSACNKKDTNLNLYNPVLQTTTLLEHAVYTQHT